ncbi:putative ABC transporter [Mollisia scopiformis]|uniref:Putative ABC transporter n=1 Tax=Mollisia scopiformis TaxID=149040 RepID=A0A132BCH2_MOLSC|nr:putative ABC transporter [Mollisia scopiformis]KUJ09554.1 putative ABC transporter [Mollisia scopiformis]
MEDFSNPFLGTFPIDSPIDPNSNTFNANSWLSNLVGFIQKDPKRYLPRSAGIAFRNLEVYGFGSPTDYQKNVGNVLLELTSLFRWMGGQKKQRIQVLRDFDGLVEAGEMCLVLGRPGSGCTTLLKTISCDTYGFFIGPDSVLNYQGIPAAQMASQFRGEAIYMAENDVHFPQLTVGDTLLFAAKARAPRDQTFPGVTQDMWAKHMRDVIMATLGIKHTTNTPVGGVLIKGVSGGERKRVSVAEALLSGSPLQCWDNSTRGLDSANALEFCKTIRLSTSLAGTSAFVSLYQGSQDAYEVFDKVTVLYEGRQVYFGPCRDAKSFFNNMGFECAPRQTTADFLTALTSPAERRVRPGYEGLVPSTADEFAQRWMCSKAYERLLDDIDRYNQKFPIGGASVQAFTESRRAQQAVQQRVGSPYTLSLYQQVMICVERGFQRLRGDASVTISRVVANAVLALVVGSMFYNLDETTDSFYSRSVLIFLAILLNAFASALEILIIFDQRPIVEKHSKYGLYHPFAEAVASTLCDMPFKVCNAVFFNLVLYFMSNLRREPGAFFVFLLFSFSMTVSLSMVFRSFGASARTLASSLFPSTITILALITYTGFVVPIGDMHPWFRWINYIDPIAYAFESLMINEYHGRYFICSPKSYVPAGPEYLNVGGLNHICATVGAVAGSDVVSGTDYIRLSFDYQPAHLWRNLGIIIALTIFFTFTYFASTEYITAKKSKGEILLFQRGSRPRNKNDVEQPHWMNHHPESNLSTTLSTSEKKRNLQKQTSVFQWKDICYDIKIKKEDRRILNRVDGWVSPGTLTALMGPSGAGKTTLLDVLAKRDTIGIASGEALVVGRPRDVSFQRKTGYAQQQDIHLETMTAREAMQFNAIMCQPANKSRSEKIDYVEEIIGLLDMGSYADAIIGVPGQGLNIEQRKKLTIAVELAARPQLLLFLDEPSSGLDSQTSWAVLDLLEKLTSHGQAILCTIHQPSAALFERFDRLLLLAPEGKPVYFGDIGDDSRTVIDYFERNGAKPCPPDANPAEWMLEVIGCTPGSHSDIEWPEVWRNSPEFSEVHHQLDHMAQHARSNLPSQAQLDDGFKEFAAPFSAQLWECLKRVNQQYWRTPSYIYSKAAMCIGSALFLGFTFYKSNNSLQGLQDQTFNIFMLITLSSNFVPQMLPNFVTQRSIYEARERPAKTYSWPVFLLSNILVELPWNALMAVLIFFAWYYPSGLYRNAQFTHTVNERSATMFLLMLAYMMFTSTFGHMVQAGVELADMGGNYANLLFMLSLIFCGVLIGPSLLPRFWIFMYRVSPFTYLVSAVLSTGLANAPVTCSSIELLHFEPLANTTCSSYLSSYLETAGGYLANPSATSDCSYCPLKDTNAFLSLLSSSYDTRWRDFGLLWVYVVVNIALAMFWYWLARVPKDRRARAGKSVSPICPKRKVETVVLRFAS